jgi:hypothetical protein
MAAARRSSFFRRAANPVIMLLSRGSIASPTRRSKEERWLITLKSAQNENIDRVQKSGGHLSIRLIETGNVGRDDFGQPQEVLGFP